MTTLEQFADEFKKAGAEEGVDRPILIRNEMQFLLASRPEGWGDVGIDSPVMWMEKCGGWFREIIDEDTSLVDDFEKGNEKKRMEILRGIGEKVKAKLLH
jgi:hypothetical protein